MPSLKQWMENIEAAIKTNEDIDVSLDFDRA